MKIIGYGCIWMERFHPTRKVKSCCPSMPATAIGGHRIRAGSGAIRTAARGTTTVGPQRCFDLGRYL